jgi:CRISPR-associated protein Csx17
MSPKHSALSAIPIPGLRPTSLGAYLAALGLLKVLSRWRRSREEPPAWPDMRAAWREGVFFLVGGPPDRDALADALMSIADQGSWTPYVRGWHDAQMKSPKTSTGAKSGAKLALWQAEAEEDELELFAAHAAPAARVFLNPLLGKGGNAGRRAFAEGWKKATQALKPPVTSKKNRPKNNIDERREALCAFLDGEASAWQTEKLNAASWFSDANKLYNSGQSPFSEGVISPWAMALACEGLTFFAGGASRRLGARTRPVGAFPFVVEAAAPETAGEARRDSGEVWTPLWARPMTVPEVAALFARGRAEIGGRGAVTPAAFAAAITRRGVDAGVGGFSHFALGKTTSENTFEPRYLGYVPVPSGSPDARADTIERLLGLFESLPRDEQGRRGRFIGLRGPIERALVDTASAPDNPEPATALLDAAIRALDRVDVNRSFRERGVTWRPLPLDWLPALFGGDVPEREARLALSLVSAFPPERPFALYRFGVEWRNKTHDGRPRKQSPYIHPKTAPGRWVWRIGSLAQNLGAVLQRRLLDWENDDGRTSPPTRTPIAVRLADVEAWLDGNIDEALLARWVSRFALFDWSFDNRAPVRKLLHFRNVRPPVGPALALYGLLHPLVDLRPVFADGRDDGRNLLDLETGARTPAAARRITALMRSGDVERAVDVGRSRYAMARSPLMRSDVPFAVANPERLLAALLFPVSNPDRADLIRRWQRPQRQLYEVTHA